MIFPQTVSIKNNQAITLRFPQTNDEQILLDFINPIIEENSYILINEKQTLESETEYLKNILKNIKSGKDIHLIALHNKKLIAKSELRANPYKQSHIKTLGITISKDFRNLGLGHILITKLIELAKLNPETRIINLTVNAENQPARHLYAKLGFKQYAYFPKAIYQDGQYFDQILMYKQI